MWVNGSFTTLKLQEFSQCLPWQNGDDWHESLSSKGFHRFMPDWTGAFADYPGNTHGHGQNRVVI
jgi:hypothetical protein